MSLFSVIKKAVKSVAKPIGKIASNNYVQAACPMLAINSAIVTRTISHGPKGGFAAAEAALKNPVMRKAAAVTAMAFPAAAPVAAAQEAAIRTLDAVKSKDPRLAAGAALQIAATMAGAKTNPDIARAAAVLKKTAHAKALLKKWGNTTGAARAAVEKEIAKTPAAQLLFLRDLDRATLSPNPKLRAAATKAKKTLVATPHGRMAMRGVQAARATPKTIQARNFTVTKDARVCLNGRRLRA